MAYVDWMIRGPKIASCSCNYGCPCEFNAPPTNPVCEGLEAQRIDEGWFGDVRLDGLIIGARYRWPGPLGLQPLINDTVIGLKPLPPTAACRHFQVF